MPPASLRPRRPRCLAALVGSAALAVLGAAGCRQPEARDAATPRRGPLPSILLVTLDTTRADAVAPEGDATTTPHLAALAGRGVRFTQAYATAPMTLPAHASMLTGLYPAAHGLHENARRLPGDRALAASRLEEAGYATAAFVSGFPLDRRFGLARGFDVYDDDLGADRSAGSRNEGDPALPDDAAERPAGETTERALAFLAAAGEPLFLWVHYFDPHDPYAPPEPFQSRYAGRPYLGEIAYVDQELGRLLAAFEARFAGNARILVVGDHGEGLGDHGEALHGNLLYQGVMRVPLVIAGDGIAAAVRDDPVSARRVFDTLLAWGGLPSSGGLLAGAAAGDEPVLGEAMKPYLQYGWQPQVMAVRDRIKAIRSGEIEVYDVVADPAESRDLAGEVELGRELRQALRAYPLPASLPGGDTAGEGGPLTQEERSRLASLGYVASEGRPSLRPGAPRAKDMAHLFGALDYGSGLFVREEYEKAIPVFEGVLAQDPGNLMVAVRLAVAHSLLGHDRRAGDYFDRARRIDPASVDVRHYQGMHHFRAGEWDRAEVLLASVLAEMPDRLPTLEALARIRERQGRRDEAASLLERVVELDGGGPPTLARLGELRMALGETAAAIDAFERARALAGEDFTHSLELGVCYLADRRLAAARESLDRVPPSHPGYPMALFKRAQVSVLLGEPDHGERVRRAWERADATTRPLIARESLFEGIALD